MFTKAHLGRVWWPVTLTQYDEAGEPVETNIRLLLEPLTRAERAKRQKAAVQTAHAALLELREQVDLTQPADDNASVERLGVDATERVMAQLERSLAATEADIELITRRIHDWRGPQDGDKPIPFSRELLADLMHWDSFAQPVLAAFNEACEGAVRKNSKPGPAGTPG